MTKSKVQYPSQKRAGFGIVERRKRCSLLRVFLQRCDRCTDVERMYRFYGTVAPFSIKR